jgi:hypothetical protein
MMLLLLALACSTEPVSSNGDDGPTLADDVPPEIPVLPVLTVTLPERGAFVGEAGVQLAGHVEAGSAPLTTLTLDGQSIELDESGGFDQAVDWAPGINILSVRVEDEGGQRAVDGRAVLAGPVHVPGTVIEDGARLLLGPDMLDDDRPDVDDVASIAELLLADPSLLADRLGVPMDTGFATVTPTSLSYSDASVDLVPAAGRIIASITLSDVEMDFDVTDIAGFSWVSTDGSAWADELVLETSLVADTSGGDIGIDAIDTSAGLFSFGLTVDWFPDFLEDDLAGWVQGTLEDELATTAEDTVGALLGGVVDALAVSTTFAGVELDMTVVDLEAAASGLRITMDISLYGAPAFTLPPGAGSLETPDNPPAWPTSATDPFVVLVDDDVVNQLMFAMWSTGALSNFVFSGDELALLSGAVLPPPLGPATEVRIDGGMPPVVSLPSEPDQDVDLSLGELTLGVTRDDGETLEFSINVRAGAVLLVNDDGELTFDLDNRPAKVGLAVGTLGFPEPLDPGDLAALVRLSVPPLLGSASAFLPGFPTPTMDLGEITGLPALAGVELGLEDPEVQVEEQAGWLILGGRLAEQ